MWTVIPTLICLFALFVVSLFFVVESLMRSSGAYQLALDKASHSPCLTNVLGTPLKPGWLISGSVNVHNSDGEANLSIPLTGSTGKGTINAEATKSAGVWRITSLDMQGKHGRVPLVPEPSGGGCTIANPAPINVDRKPRP